LRCSSRCSTILSGTSRGGKDDQIYLGAFLELLLIISNAFLGIYCAVWGFRRDSRIMSPEGP
jgi:hypothetical protein